MRVLLFRSLCDTGGVSTSMLLLGRELQRRGIHCEYWFCAGSNRYAEFEATGHATLGTVGELARRFDRGDFDVVHMTATDPGAHLVARLAGRTRVVVTARGAIADIWNHTNCHAYTAISKGMAALNQPYTDVEIEVVRNSIEVGRYSPPAERAAGAPIVAFAGRTTSHEKNFARFTRIAQHLVAQGARVWIADPHEAGWDRFTAPNVAKFPVERWQRVSHADMPDFYRAIAASGGVLVITSMSEGFGNVAPEAAACGARVAAHDVIGLREAVVDGVTGRLFPISMSEIDVAAMLERWLAEPHDMMAVSEATKREYSPSVMVEGYLSAYARPKARLVTAKLPPPADTPELKHLLGHLRDQGNWRAQFEREAAVHLMRASYKRRAVAALGMAFRAAPGQFLGPSAARQVITIGRGLIGGVGGGRS